MALFFKYPTLRRIVFFFPFQLLLILIRSNPFLLVTWVIIFGFITNNLAPKYGISYLFLDPEYLGKVNFWSYLIMGLASGGFIMSYNIASYIRNSYHFPFIATLSRPFLKYSVNNFAIPAIFIITYTLHIINFQMHNEFQSLQDILLDVSGLFIGMFIFLFIGYVYFFSTNKNIFALFGIHTHVEDEEVVDGKDADAAEKQKSKDADIKKATGWKIIDPSKVKDRTWHIETYLSTFMKIRLARGVEHYDEEMLMFVYNQHHLNAARFQILLFISIILLGFLRDYEAFVIPAGASILMLVTTFQMIFSAVESWLRGWTVLAIIVVIFSINYFSKFEFFNSSNQAFGLNYQTNKAVYHQDSIRYMCNDIVKISQDKEHTLEILNKWKNQNSKKKTDKPPLVIINTSGGGLRSACWTFRVLQQADSITEGKLFNYAQMITGASGGMMGAAYFRELYLQQINNSISNINDDIYWQNMSSDLLNPVAFTYTIHDFFVNFQRVIVDKYSYPKDRGYAFELQLNKNTGFVMDKTMEDYYLPEYERKIPLMIFTPTIINDGKRLIIASQPVSYLAYSLPKKHVAVTTNPEDVDFANMFKEQGASNLKFLTAIRMNATFPYILPPVTLPSQPVTQVMDAGIRDNYGLKTTIKFLYSFKDWITLNTSEVIIVQIIDRKKILEVKDTQLPSTFENMINPVGKIYGNMFNIQDYSNDQLIQYASLWFDGKIEVINFELPNIEPNRVSLSWHLTSKEKEIIYNATELENNKSSMKKLYKKLLQPEEIYK